MIRSIRAYASTINFISKYNLWKYIIIPGLLSVIVIGLLIGSAVSGFALGGGEAALEEWLIRILPDRFTGEWAEKIIHAIPFWSLLLGVLTAGLFIVGKYIILVMSSPFMPDLSRKVEEILTGRQIRDEGNFITDFLRGLLIAIRNLCLELLFTLLILPLNLIPVIGNIAALVLGFMVQAFYAGAGNMDFMLERKRLSIGQSISWVKAHRGMAIGNGAGFLAIFFVPVIGWFLAPSMGCIAATHAMYREFE